MKTLLTCFLIVWSLTADGQVAAKVGPGRNVSAPLRVPRYHNHPFTPLLFEDFENPTGYDLPGWTEVISGGAINEDYTATVLFGTQSLFMDGASDDPTYVTNSFPATSKVFLAFRFRLVSATGGSANRTLIRLMAADDTCLMRLNISGTDLEIQAVICETSDAAGTFVISAGVEYTFWIEYNKDNGANSFLSFAISQNHIRPLAGSAGYFSVTGVQLTKDPAIIMIGSNNDDNQVALQYIVDHLLVDDEQINDWP